MDIPRAAGAPARRALSAAGWIRLDQLTAVTERELLALHGVGPKAIGVLRAALRDRGLSLAGEETGA
ncbi:DNA-binding protein [Micromonospora sp. CPCC 205739]